MAGDGNGNGAGWRGWLLGIGATVLATLIINGISFQRDTRKDLTANEVKIKNLEQRLENILKYLSQRMDELHDVSNTADDQINKDIGRLEKRVEELEKRGR
jgi:peptidoglycan hydrolase CwlO-like protein